ncbi:transaldolase [Citrobacter portucalensis]|uniref:transaldolase n=1 Tax=Citrobacter portucalensis TaxID=1639133 RepID=UPI00226B5003|nr:transaldolase [Citrobacter portucalensis]MCX8990491.1 transaldolase [Citrobacter portucalensis]
MNTFEALGQLTTLVVDSGDIESIIKYQPQDVTTNPSLIYKALSLPSGKVFITEAVSACRSRNIPVSKMLTAVCEQISVLIGKRIAAHIPGVISTEVDARLAYDTEGCIQKARELIYLYEEYGVSRDKVLIKLAATWEGIRAAEILEQEGIHCNLTLLFSFAQARACADARVTLISPFVGRITDWYKARKPEVLEYEDPGVESVRKIYRYYKAHGYRTIIMGASFRTPEQVIALAGCDKLTVSPGLLQQLQERNQPVERGVYFEISITACPAKMDEKTFRWEHNSDPMAVEKLAEGIRLFAEDQRKMEGVVSAFL